MVQNKAVNVLFTSVGRRVELLRAFRQAYEDLGLNGKITAIDIDPLSPALQLADRAYLVPRLDKPDYVPTLVSICQQEEIDVVFPLIDPDIPVLAANRSSIGATGARVAVVSPEAAKIGGDKWLTYRFFRDLGLPTPESWLPGQLDPQVCDYPLFIKPRGGSAAQNTFRINDPDEFRFYVKRVPNPILQEYLPGAEITNDVLCDLTGSVLAVVSRKRLEVRSGEVAKGVTVHDPFIVESCVRIAKALPALGPLTVQCMYKDEKPYLTEINARFGGGVPLGIAAGVNAPQWLLARIAGIPTEIPPLGTYRVGLHLTRFDDSFFLGEDDLEQIPRYHL